MPDDADRGLGKCEQNHPGAYGYPARPEEPYAFCSTCGKPMVWQCPRCSEPLPLDSAELVSARFCRDCGAPYFAEAEGASQAAGS